MTTNQTTTDTETDTEIDQIISNAKRAQAQADKDRDRKDQTTCSKCGINYRQSQLHRDHDRCPWCGQKR